MKKLTSLSKTVALFIGLIVLAIATLVHTNTQSSSKGYEEKASIVGWCDKGTCSINTKGDVKVSKNVVDTFMKNKDSSISCIYKEHEIYTYDKIVCRNNSELKEGETIKNTFINGIKI